jgi:hypothetical protein
MVAVCGTGALGSSAGSGSVMVFGATPLGEAADGTVGVLGATGVGGGVGAPAGVAGIVVG